MRKKIKHNNWQNDASSILPPCNKKGQGDVTIFSCVVHKISLEGCPCREELVPWEQWEQWCEGDSPCVPFSTFWFVNHGNALKAGGEGDSRGWDGWMVSLTQWTWVWASSGRWWITGKTGVLLSMGSQKVRHDRAAATSWWMDEWTKFKRKEGNSFSCTLEDGEVMDGEADTFIEYLGHGAVLLIL